MAETKRFAGYVSVLHRRPDARAVIAGSEEYRNIHGMVRFYQTRRGVLIAAEVTGLPHRESPCDGSFFGFHIHSGEFCSGNETDPFTDALTHYNPQDCPHPAHAGDLPPLLGNRGYAFQIFFTDRFTVREILGKTIIIHDSADDFVSQPGGNAGAKIACGEIRRLSFR